MATAYINQERFGVQFEDRINALVNIDPDETPFMTMLKKSEGYNQRTDFQSHVLDTSNASNSGVDGADVTNAAADYTAPTALFNYMQMPQRPFGASFSYDAVKKPGIGSGSMSGVSAEKLRKMKALKLDMEASLLSNNQRQQPLPESTQAGLLRGSQRWIATNIVTATDAKWGGATLSSKMFFECARLCVRKTSGGKPETVFANTFNRLQINDFVGPPTRDIDSLGRKIMHMVDVIFSIAGPQQVVLSLELSDDVVLMMEMKYWEQRWLRAPQTFMKGLAGSRTDGWVEAEHTLVCWAEKSSGKIVSTATA